MAIVLLLRVFFLLSFSLFAYTNLLKFAFCVNCCVYVYPLHWLYIVIKIINFLRRKRVKRADRTYVARIKNFCKQETE